MANVHSLSRTIDRDLTLDKAYIEHLSQKQNLIESLYQTGVDLQAVKEKIKNMPILNTTDADTIKHNLQAWKTFSPKEISLVLFIKAGEQLPEIERLQHLIKSQIHETREESNIFHKITTQLQELEDSNQDESSLIREKRALLERLIRKQEEVISQLTPQSEILRTIDMISKLVHQEYDLFNSVEIFLRADALIQHNRTKKSHSSEYQLARFMKCLEVSKELFVQMAGKHQADFSAVFFHTRLISDINKHKNLFISHLSSAIHRTGEEAFHVLVRDLEWYSEKIAEWGVHKNLFSGYKVTLQKILSTYLSIQSKDLNPKTISLPIEEVQGTVSENYEFVRMKKLMHSVSRLLLSTAAIVGGLSSFWLWMLSPLARMKLLQRSLKKASQAPGLPMSRFQNTQLHAMDFIANDTSPAPGMMLVMKQSQQYNLLTDSLSSIEVPRKKYDNGLLMPINKAIIQFNNSNMYVINLIYPVTSKDDYIELPNLWSKYEFQFVPLAAAVLQNQQPQLGSRTLRSQSHHTTEYVQLYYDHYSRLFVKRSEIPSHYKNVWIQLSFGATNDLFESRKRMVNDFGHRGFNAFYIENKDFFHPPCPKIDKKLIFQKSGIPDDLLSELRKDSEKLVTDTHKMERARWLFHKRVHYPTMKDSAKMKNFKGTVVSRIVRSGIANCYDAARVGMVLGAQFGIVCQIASGLVKPKSGRSFMGLGSIRQIKGGDFLDENNRLVRHRHLSYGYYTLLPHAVVLYYSNQEKRWIPIDFTPPSEKETENEERTSVFQIKRRKKERKSISRETAKEIENERKRHPIDYYLKVWGFNPPVLRLPPDTMFTCEYVFERRTGIHDIKPCIDDYKLDDSTAVYTVLFEPYYYLLDTIEQLSEDIWEKLCAVVNEELFTYRTADMKNFMIIFGRGNKQRKSKDIKREDFVDLIVRVICRIMLPHPGTIEVSYSLRKKQYKLSVADWKSYSIATASKDDFLSNIDRLIQHWNKELETALETVKVLLKKRLPLTSRGKKEAQIMLYDDIQTFLAKRLTMKKKSEKLKKIKKATNYLESIFSGDATYNEKDFVQMLPHDYSGNFTQRLHKIIAMPESIEEYFMEKAGQQKTAAFSIHDVVAFRLLSGKMNIRNLKSR